jgi:hypothetical protein
MRAAGEVGRRPDQPSAGGSRGARGAASARQDVGLGWQLALAGGRSTWLRLLLMTVGAGLCVTVLLLAAAIGPAISTRQERMDTRAATSDGDPSAIGPDGTTTATAVGALTSGVGQFQFESIDFSFQGRSITGYALAPLDDSAPPPPGAAGFPAPGELLVSPALAQLLADPAAADLASLLPGRTIGTIDGAALLDPGELRVYQGVSPAPDVARSAPAPSRWGAQQFTGGMTNEVFVSLLLIAGTTVIIVPLVFFLALMSRLAGSMRDRRHATMRLLGASATQLRRVALTETAIAAALGLLIGGGCFLLARQAAPLLRINGAGFFPADLVPGPVLLLLIVVGVPLLAAAIAVFSDRPVVTGPLTVARGGESARRRFGWRAVVLVLGAAITAVSISPVRMPLPVSLGLLAGGLALLMISVAALLPWAVERLIGWLDNGSPSWQLATRRLQQDAGIPSRLVAGACVVLTGAIALQTLLVLSGENAEQDRAKPIPASSYYLRMAAPTLPEVSEIADRLLVVPGVTDVVGGLLTSVEGAVSDPTFPRPGGMAVIADCATLPDTVACRDGDVFLQTRPENLPDQSIAPAAGSVVYIGELPATAQWIVPTTLRPIDVGVSSDSSIYWSDLVVTPGALNDAQLRSAMAGAVMDLRVSTDAPPGSLLDALAVASGRPATELTTTSPAESGGQRDELRATARAGLTIGGGLTVLVAALGLLVMSVEQLLQRRRSLTLAVSSGVPRAVLARSHVIYAAVPMVIGVVLAAVVGNALALTFLWLLDQPVGIDVGITLVYAGAAVGAVILTTAAAVPVLYRITRPSDLRTG